ncbi:hypothetical protein HWQ67_18760, partial [Candidatus Magnetobacterium casensis]
MESKELTVVNIEDYAMTTDRVVHQVALIQDVMKAVMKEGEHYGTIPGTQKPTLYKPGAEKLGVTFRLVPSYDIKQKDLPAGHREYMIVCTLTHGPSGQLVAQGLGACSTMESKYRYRNKGKECPICQSESIRKGQEQYGGGWFCYQKSGGCGRKFKDGDDRIEMQVTGKVEHTDPADYYNTVLKMAMKRAHVSAILTATACSDIFTQDLEDLPSHAIPKVVEGEVLPKEPPKPESPQTT